jgi:hypothetical protein
MSHATVAAFSAADEGSHRLRHWRRMLVMSKSVSSACHEQLESGCDVGKLSVREGDLNPGLPPARVQAITRLIRGKGTSAPTRS